MNKKARKYTTEDLSKACASSYSINQVVLFLNVSDSGANYSNIRRDILNNGIDVSHFGKIKKAKTPIKNIDDILENCHKKSSEIKKFLLNNEILTNKCALCGLGNEWNGKLIVLQLDHIDGNSKNNKISNLRILCPNCHSQTPTFCRSAKKNSDNDVDKNAIKVN